MRESSRQSVDAPKRWKDNDKEDSDQKAFASKAESSTSWYSRAGRLSRQLSRQFTSEDILYGETVPDNVQWSGSAALLSSRGVAVASVVLLLASICGAMLFRSYVPLQRDVGAPGVAKYLRDIAAWHEVSGSDRMAASAFADFEASMKACAKQVKLPEVQLPKQLPGATSWQPSGTYPADPLDALALNCSSPEDAAACELAAGSNSYEGDLQPLDPDELATYLMPVETSDHELEGAQDPLQELAQLELNCDEDPAACAVVADLTNSYSADDDTAATDAFDAAAEAAAYLHAAHTPSGWDAVIGTQQQQQQELTAEQQQEALQGSNSYEGNEHTWKQRRISEEAGAQYMDASLLDLDCSAVGDADTEIECERSRAVNRYEAAAASGLGQDATLQPEEPATGAATVIVTVGNMQFEHLQHGFRTVGYDVAAVDWEEFAAGATPADTERSVEGWHRRSGCSHDHHHSEHDGSDGRQHASSDQDQQQIQLEQLQQAAEEVIDVAEVNNMPIDKLLRLQLQLQQIIQQRRVTGYDVPAIDEEEQAAAASATQKTLAAEPGQQPVAAGGSAAVAAAAAAVGVATLDGASSVQRDDLAQARLYFKNPCNDPATHQQYKNRLNHPMHRVYYKNPANAPVYLNEEQAAPVESPGYSTSSFKVPSSWRSLLLKALSVLVAFAASAAGTWYIMVAGFGSRRRSASPAVHTEIIEQEAAAGVTDVRTHRCVSSSTNLAPGISGELPTPQLAQIPLPLLIINEEPWPCEPPSNEDECTDIAAAAAAAADMEADAFGGMAALAVQTQDRIALLDDVPPTGVDSPRGHNTPRGRGVDSPRWGIDSPHALNTPRAHGMDSPRWGIDSPRTLNTPRARGIDSHRCHTPRTRGSTPLPPK